MKQNNSNPLNFVDECFLNMDLHKNQVAHHTAMAVYIAHDSLIKKRD